MSATTILIDEDSDFRREVNELLLQFAEFKVVGEVDDGRKGEALAQQRGTTELAPDLDF